MFRKLVLVAALALGSLGFATACHTKNPYVLCADHRRSDEVTAFADFSNGQAYCDFRTDIHHHRCIVVDYDDHQAHAVTCVTI